MGGGGGGIQGPPNSYRDLPLGPGGDPDPKFSKKRKWDFWNQCVKGFQKNHHLP